MRKIFCMIAITVFTLVFTACIDSEIQDNTIEIPELTIINMSSYDLVDVKFADILFSSPGSNELSRLGGQSTKNLTVNHLNNNYTGLISFVRKDIGIECRVERSITINKINNSFTIDNSTVVEEVANTSNRKTLSQITFISNLVIEKNGSFIPKNYNVNLGEGVINFPVNDEDINVFTIKNSGVGDLLLTGTEPVKISGPGANAFTVIQPVVTNGRVNPNSSVTFKVNFIPTAEQVYYAFVTIQSNNQEGDFSFSITATGVPPKPIAHVFFNDLEILNEGLIDAGEIFITQSKEIVVVIRNSGAATLVIQNTDISITGQDRDAFIKTTNPSANVSVNGQTSFRIECVPNKVGENNAVLTIPTNDISCDPIIIHLKTYGVRGAAIFELSQDGKIIENNSLSTYDFGRVEIGTFQTRTFIIKNTGNINLNLPAVPNPVVSSSNPVFVAQLQPSIRVLTPGSSTTFIIRLQPSAEAEVSTFINIENDGDDGLFSFIIKGIGYVKKPHIDIQYEGMEIQQNATIDAGEILITQARNINVIIRNTGEALLDIDTSNITITGTNSSAFSKITNPAANISVGGQSSFVIRCEPAVDGENNAILTIPSSDINRNPVTVFLKVTGVRGAPILELHQDSLLILNNSIVPLDFGQVTIGSGGFKTFAFTIKNTGNIALNLTGNPIIQSDNAVFSVQTQPANNTLNPADTAAFIIRYTPIAERVDNASITIANNSNTALFTINVTGNGYMQKPLAKITHGTTEIAQNGTINEGDVLLTTSKVITVTINNLGDASLIIDTANITITGNDASAFARISSPSSSVQPNNSTSFNIEFTPKKQGECVAILTIPTNDVSNSSFVINLKAAGVAPNSTTLTANTWADGNITAAGGTQWFRFNASSANHYIHAEFGTLSNLWIQLYDENGSAVGIESNLSGSINNITRSLTSGQLYYIRVRPASGSGTYKIGFNSTFLSPSIVINALASNTWANGNVAANGAQWFSFTASAAAQFLYVLPGSLANISVLVYNTSGNLIGSESSLNSSNPFVSAALTAGNVYYVRARPTSGSGTFNIAYNASFSPPGAASLTANTWADGNITTTTGMQWFSFTATAAAQSIHSDFGTLSNIDVLVYDSSGNAFGSEARLSGNTRHLARTLTQGQVYSVRVRPASGSGTYKIGFTSSVVPPGESSIVLSKSTWANGSIGSSSGTQWFTFTATAVSQYIYINFDTLRNVNIQLYDNNGNTAGAETLITSSSISYNIVRTLIIGQQYYVRVRPNSGSGSYKISFNTPGATALAEGSWTAGNIAAPVSGLNSNTEWFRFTATAQQNFIHFGWGTLNDIVIQLYDSNGDTIGGESRYAVGLNWNRINGLTLGEEYFLRIRANTTNASGTYQITFSKNIVGPNTTVVQLTANTWELRGLSALGSVWYGFSATAATHYLHWATGNMTSGAIALYDSNNNSISAATAVNNPNNIQTRSYQLTVGQQYYVYILSDNTFSVSMGLQLTNSATPPALPTQ